MIRQLKCLFVFVVLNPQLLFASQYAVNMQDGGLILKDSTEFSNPRGKYKLERVYRSRSLSRGFFGQGWCTQFESQLVFLKPGVLHLENCSPQNRRPYQLDKSASAYLNPEDSNDLIRIKMGYYERIQNGHPMARYNFHGQLVQIEIQNQKWTLDYNERKLPRKISSGDFFIDLTWHPLLDLIQKITTSGKESFHFEFEGFQLIRVKSQDSVEYQYDDLDNLVIRKSGSQKTSFRYNRQEDQIQEIQSNCRELYEFKTHQKGRVQSSITKLCPLSQKTVTQFDFYFETHTRRPSQVKVVETQVPRTVKNKEFP